MTEAVRLAYAQGFMDKCAEAGLDPEKIAQDAQTGATASRAGAYMATALNPVFGGALAPLYSGIKSDDLGKGLAAGVAVPAATIAGAAPGVSLMGRGVAKRFTAPAVATVMPGRQHLARELLADFGHGGLSPRVFARLKGSGKAQIVAGLLAALTGGLVAGGETTYALSKRR